MTFAQQYQRLAQAALRRGDGASARIYQRQAAEHAGDGGRFVGGDDDVEFSTASPPRSAPLRHGREQSPPARRAAPQPLQYAPAAPENVHAAKLEAALRLLFSARTEAELEQAREQFETLRGMSDADVQALA